MADHPRNPNARGPVVVAPDQRAGFEGGAGQSVVSYVRTRPELRITLRKRREHLGASEAARSVVRRTIRCRVLRCHRVVVLVVATRCKEWARQQPEVPP